MSLWFRMIFMKSFNTKFITNIAVYSIFIIFGTVYNFIIHIITIHFLNRFIWNKVDDFMNVIKRDPKVQLEKDILATYINYFIITNQK